MEAAWTEATQDPDLQAAWKDQSDLLDDDGEPETLQGVWGRTANQLETGDYLEGARREAPYELNPENRFSELGDPFAEGVRLFEDGQIADAALCFEAEIARNPENSQVCAGGESGNRVGFGTVAVLLTVLLMVLLLLLASLCVIIVVGLVVSGRWVVFLSVLLVHISRR